MLKLIVNNPWGKIDYLQAEVERTHTRLLNSALFVSDAVADFDDAHKDFMDAVEAMRQAEIIEKLTTVGKA